MQELVDCTYTRDGCQGGWMTTAHNYLVKVGGPLLESDHNYVSGTTKTWTNLNYNTSDICPTLTGTRNFQPKNLTSGGYVNVGKTKEAHLRQLELGRAVAIAFYAKFTT